ncbi:hypothetical protein J6590_007649 [Homalodisca vitripennis]|nr:hypothetical protein J6590_007649 [Homalodisca vitripennis]
MSQNCCYKLECKDPRLSFTQTWVGTNLTMTPLPPPVLAISRSYVCGLTYTDGFADAGQLKIMSCPTAKDFRLNKHVLSLQARPNTTSTF